LTRKAPAPPKQPALKDTESDWQKKDKKIEKFAEKVLPKGKDQNKSTAYSKLESGTSEASIDKSNETVKLLLNNQQSVDPE
jgi:hypothetical protein